MKYTSLDTVVKGYLLQRKWPIHFYVDCLIYAARCFEEIHFDSIANIRTVKLPVNSNFAVRLPDDYMDWTKVGVENGQFVKPLIQREGINRLNNYTTIGIIATLGSMVAGSGYTDGSYTNIALTGGFGSGATANFTVVGGIVTVFTLANGGQNYAQGDLLNVANLGGTGTGFSITVLTVTDSGAIPYPTDLSPDNGTYNYFFSHFLGYYVNYNDHLEYVGRTYGVRVDRSDSFKVLPERNEIQLHEDIGADYIILEYISDGSESDNLTQITPYAKSTIEAYINWKYKENGRSYSEGERARAEQLFIKEHKRLRARMNPLTLNDIRASYYKNSTGAPR